MVQSQDDSARIRGYLLAQGEKYSYVEMWPRAVRTRLELLEALDGVADAQAAFKPSADDWSIREVALHVLNGSHRVQQVVDALAAGRPATAEFTDPPHELTELGIDELRRRLLQDSVEWSALTERLPATPSFAVTANHMFFGELHSLRGTSSSACTISIT